MKPYLNRHFWRQNVTFFCPILYKLRMQDLRIGGEGIHSLDHPARRVPALVSLQRDSSGSLVDTRGQHGEPARCTGDSTRACTGVDSGKWRLSVGDRMPSWLTDKVALEVVQPFYSSSHHLSRLRLSHLQIQPQTQPWH